MQLVILVEVTTGAGHHDITDVPFQLDTIGSVFLDRDFHVQSVFSDDAYGSVLDRIFIDIVYDSFDEDGDRRPFKGIYMVIAPCVVAVGAEEAPFLFSGEVIPKSSAIELMGALGSRHSTSLYCLAWP